MLPSAKPEPPTIMDEPGMAERFQRGLRAFQTPHKPITPKNNQPTSSQWIRKEKS